jgi:uncharacterized protein (DUF433 family)
MNNTPTLNDHIEVNSEVMGGKACIKGHRISVKDIVIWHERMGISADEIATQYHLNLSDVYAALTYYYDHQEEVDEDIRKEKDWISELQQKFPSKLIRK